MELEPLRLLTTILEQYSVSEPLRQGESKINASIDFSNQIAEQMNKHTKWLQFVGDEVIRKIAKRPYFFNILDDMLHCDYLTNNTCCFVLGTDSPTDGRMKLFYIVNTLPDGKEVDSVNVYQLDSGLYALYTTEETITTLRELILQNSQEIDSLKEMVETGGNSYTPDNPPPYPVTTVAGKTGAVVLNKSDVGLASVDNVRQYSSSNPPPYPVTSVAGRTGVVTLSKSDVGLGNVNNTSDVNKPISAATQNALNLKAPLASPAFTGNASITGNLTLKGSGNYGNKINFGDGDYVYISETADDILELKGKEITVSAPTVNVTGNMRLKGSGNYGNILNFGDGDYVHIAEPSDDTLEIKGTRVNLLGEVKINGRAPGYSKKSAMVVVGTTKSGHTLADCDFLCTGTDDNVTIQKALDSLPVMSWSEGYHTGTVHLLEGIYNFSSRVLPSDGVIISGCGGSTVIKRMYNETSGSRSTLGLFGDNLNRSSTCIRDLKIDGNKGSYSYQYNNGISSIGTVINVVIKNCSGTAFASCNHVIGCYAALCSLGASGCDTVSSSSFVSNGKGCTYCDSVSNVRIWSSTTYDFEYCAMVTGCTSLGSQISVYNSNAVGNYIYQCEDTAIFQNSSTYGITIGNYVRDTGMCGIKINDTGQIVMGNRVIKDSYTSTQYSINLTGSYSNNFCIGNVMKAKGITNSQTSSTVVYNSVI